MTLTENLIQKLQWDKYADGLIPAVIQDIRTKDVLMLGFMNEEALRKTAESGKVTFFSRSRQTLWTKGESSGNFLLLEGIKADCDSDTLLVTARPVGPVCHTGTQTCFGDLEQDILARLGTLIEERKQSPSDESYTSSLFKKGRERIAQKVGEEGVEVALAHMSDDKNKTTSEAADMLFHLMVLLADADLTLDDVKAELRRRHKA